MKWRTLVKVLGLALCLGEGLSARAAQALLPHAQQAQAPHAPAQKQHFETGERTVDLGAPFGTVTLYAPAGQPKSVVLFMSGDGGWELGVIDMARHLRDAGAAVAGLDVRHYLADIAADKSGNCRYLAADFETLAHRVEREMGLPQYLQPLLYGYSSGATIVYAALVQSPPGTFGAAVSLGFCPDQKFGGKALCPGGGAKLTYHAGPKGAWVFDPVPKLSDPWVIFQGESDSVCSASTTEEFAAKVGNANVVTLPKVGHGYGVERNWLPQFMREYTRLATLTSRVPTRAPAVADLPVIEQPASGNARAPLAVLLTGDGGWAGLDRGVAQAFNERGVPVVALSSLQYFWHARTPEAAAADVARVIRHYLAAWQRERVMLVGYSFGADVLPFIVNRLPADLRARIQSVDLLGLSNDASFEIHVAGWIPGAATGALPVKPELARMQGVEALCLYGAGERDDPCARLAGGPLTAQQLGEGHHFGGDYGELASAMLRHAGIEAPASNPATRPGAAGAAAPP